MEALNGTGDRHYKTFIAFLCPDKPISPPCFCFVVYYEMCVGIQGSALGVLRDGGTADKLEGRYRHSVLLKVFNITHSLFGMDRSASRDC